MVSKHIQQYPIPEEFPQILHDFAKEIVRSKPNDILHFGIEYFKAFQNKDMAFEYQNSSRSNKDLIPFNVDNDAKSVKSGKSKESAHSENKNKAEQFVDTILKESKDFIQRKEESVTEKNDINNKLKSHRNSFVAEEESSKTIEEPQYAITANNEIALVFVEEIMKQANDTHQSQTILNTI